MNRKLICLLLALSCLLTLSACGCKHETWNDADCTTPKTCAECGETEGEALGHTWFAATCTEPKTCETCGLTEGDAKGHSWIDATCTNPKNCSECHEIEGEALGHTWLDATTEAPQTCETCGETEGDRIITDERFTTAACAPVFGKWSAEITLPASYLDSALASYAEEIVCIFNLDFHNDGTMSLSVAPADEAQFIQMMTDFTVDATYQEFEAMGINQEGADLLIQESYGMTIEEYVAEQLALVDISEIFSSLSVEYVYYVEDNLIYLGMSWNMPLESEEFTLEGDTLYLPIESDEPTAFNRVTE